MHRPLLALVVLLGQGCTAPAPKLDDARVAGELHAFAKHYLTTMSGGEETNIRALFVPDERFRWDTDGRTVYRSAEDVLTALGQLKGMKLVTRCREDLEILVFSEQHGYVRCAFETEAQTADGDNSFRFEGILSMAMEKGPGGWQVLSGHTSTRRPPPPAEAGER